MSHWWIAMEGPRMWCLRSQGQHSSDSSHLQVVVRFGIITTTCSQAHRAQDWCSQWLVHSSNQQSMSYANGRTIARCFRLSDCRKPCARGHCQNHTNDMVPLGISSLSLSVQYKYRVKRHFMMSKALPLKT